MFPKFNRVAAFLALLLFGVAQYQGWSLFDNVANNGNSQGGSGSSRVYHK